mmetsp:Transcript_17578/g.27192  ORF Transcript_17578/g.27192 Transcript_17578/m.27192 type:complete len:94 (-) Transcript_17578:74-355(-)
MENKGGPLTEDLQFLDPNLPDMSATRVRESKKPFREAIVFMVGSGNYIEYQDLQDSAKKGPTSKNIIYGTTEMVSSSEFLRQLSVLGGKRFGV